MRFPISVPKQPTLALFLLLYALLAVWIDFSHIHRRHHADTLLFTLAGQYALRAFFWEQDRVGLLVPALTCWCPDPYTELLAQTGLTIFLGLSATLLLAEAVVPHPAGRIAATLANVVLLAVAPDRVLDNVLIETTYPTAIALGCAGLVVLDRGGRRPGPWRYVLSMFLFVLAHWVYAGVILILFPLAFGTAVFRSGAGSGLRESVRRFVRNVPGWGSLLLLAASFGAGLVFMKLAQLADPALIGSTPNDALPAAEWPASWLAYLETLNTLPQFMEWLEWAGGLAGLGLAGAGAVAVVRGARPGWPVFSALVVLALCGLTELGVMGTRAWPAENGRNPRYVLGLQLTTHLLLALAATAPLAGWIAGRCRWVAFMVLGALLVASATYRYDFPAPINPRQDLEDFFGERTRSFLEADADAIGGQYWTVWPVVFYAGVIEPARKEPVLAVTLRGGVFRPTWVQKHPNGMRVAVPDNETEINIFFLAAHCYGMTPPERVGTKGAFAIFFTRPGDWPPKPK
jgi:hypothetical protein